jgi:5,10-methenyltetrahydromethanopterin hydrogenase
MIKIELPESMTVTKGPRNKSWSASVGVDLSKLSPEMVARLAVHGAHQKIADAASGATTADEATASMQKAADAIIAGTWTSRTAGAGVDEETRVARIVVRNAVKAKFGSKSPEWAKFTGMSDDEQVAKLDSIREANADAFMPAITAEMERRAKAAADRSGLAKSVSIEL